MKILHLMHDWLFADSVISMFDVMPADSTYVIVKVGDKTLNKVKQTDEVVVIGYNSPEGVAFLREGRWDVVWVHGADSIKAWAVDLLDSKIKVVWSSWGYDYQRFNGVWTYGPRTTWLMIRALGIKFFLKTLFCFSVARLRLTHLLPLFDCRFFKRVDYYSTVIPQEVKYVGRLLRADAKWVKFHYCSRKSNVGVRHVVNLSAKRLMIGNSAQISNNHLDILPIVSRHAPQYDVVLPLCYALNDKEKYASIAAVDKVKSKLFGSRLSHFEALMPYQDYVGLLSSISIFIYGHQRQGAMGNIGIALRSGGCVVLDKRSPVYEYFISNGVQVYRLEDLRKGADWLIADFKKKQAANVEAYNALRSVERMTEDIRQTVSFLTKEIERSGMCK